MPGATHVPVEDVASTANGIPLEFDGEEVQRTLNEIGPETDVMAIVYDNLRMMSAARGQGSLTREADHQHPCGRTE